MPNRFFLTFFLFINSIGISVRAQEIMTNQSIMNLHQNNVSSSLIVDKIRSSRSRFDLTTNGLIQLLGAKVNGSVLEAMMQQTSMTDVLINEDVIKLRGADMSRKLLAQKINGSPAQFDMSTAGLIQLKNGKVPDAIQKLMMVAPSAQGMDKSVIPASKMDSKANKRSSLGNAGANDMKGVKCTNWLDKFTKKNVTVSQVILRGKKMSNILLGRSTSTLAGVEDMEVTLLFRRDDRHTVLVLYATKPGVNNLQVERNKTLMFLLNDESVIEFKPIMDSEYGIDFDYGGYNLNSKLCVYYEIDEKQLRILTKKLVKSYRLNTYNRHTNDDTVNQSRAEQVQIAAHCMLDEVTVTYK